MRGEDGLDEFTTAAPTRVWVAAGGAVARPWWTRLTSASRGRRRATCAAATRPSTPTSPAGCSPARPARCATRCWLNAAAALAARDGLDDPGRLASDEALVATIGAAIVRAGQAIDSGRAADVLDRWVSLATELRAGA